MMIIGYFICLLREACFSTFIEQKVKIDPKPIKKRLARGVMDIVVGDGHDDTSSNPGRDWLHFT